MSRSRVVRLSQTISPFGVGAIYDLLGESLVACDTTYWGPHGEVLRCPRLEEDLGVGQFRSAPASADNMWSVPKLLKYVRFPKWLFCPRCRTMYKWRTKFDLSGDAPKCSKCRKQQLVPMRFVAACNNGHLFDVPWEYWAHSKSDKPGQKQCRSKDLRFVTSRERGAGLESLSVVCQTCKARRTLAGISTTDSLKAIGIKCDGLHPWQHPEHARPCKETPQVLQRGASNLYFSQIRSALDIPPDSDYSAYSDLKLRITADPKFVVVMSAPDGPLAATAVEVLADEYGAPPEVVRGLVDAELAAREARPHAIGLEGDLETAEWTALTHPKTDYHEKDRFILKDSVLVREGEAADSEAEEALDSVVDRVVLVTRLREVRALTGFSRFSPSGPAVPPDLDKGLDWLPAIEVYGEGVFITLAEDALRDWEASPQVQERARRLEARRSASFFGGRLPSATPRFLLLHTLAHGVIRQLSFDCGYPTASLRERIYCKTPEEGDPQAGILVFTAAGDVEGTLGGLVRQGEPPLLARTLLATLESMSWCSSDPICRESSGQGTDSMNLGACHACALLPETSCAYANTLLDRTLVVGEGSPPGFLRGVMDLALSEALAVGR